MTRIDALKKLAFEKKNFDAFLVTSEVNQLYFTGTPGSAALFVPRKGESIVFVYGVNYEQTKAEARGLRVEKIRREETVASKLAPLLKTGHVKKLGADNMSYEYYQLVAKAIRGLAKIKIQGDLIWELRKVKDDAELKLMRKAGMITAAGMKAAYEYLKPGVTEIEVAREIEYAMRTNTGYGVAFDTIVASGIRSAYPHGGCGDRKIREGDLVVIDIGGIYEFYRSDMTRTLVAGDPSAKQQKLYGIVKAAQENAYRAIKPRTKGKDVDEAARKTIEEAGYSEYFVHGLGHGVGLDIHEMPTMGPSSKDILAVGNVVTNEPGIYFPGYGGFRIEDTVLVREGQGEKFTKGSYSLRPE